MINFSSNLSEESQIGFVNGSKVRIGPSNLSIVMLHGLDQGRFSKPDFWWDEDWSRFDMGLLPGEKWAERWRKASLNPRAHPKKGVFISGWPKSDLAYKSLNSKKIDFSLLNSFKHRNRKTILYAPGFETDGKQLDVINAVKDLGVNLLIKHWIDEEDKYKYVDIYNNIREANKYAIEKAHDYCLIVNPKVNIFSVLAISDLLITDESSVSLEAAIMGIPVISVNGWPMRINNLEVPRFNTIPDEVIFAPKISGLRTAIKKVINNPKPYTYDAGQDIAFLGEGAKKLWILLSQS